MIRFPRIRLPRISMPGTLPLPKVPGIKRIQTSGVKPIFFVVGIIGLAFSLGLFLIINYGGGGAPVWPTAGGAYLLPTSEIGAWLPPDVDEPERRNQTIQVHIANGALIDNLEFTNVSLGKTGLTDCFKIERAAGNTTGFLHVGQFILHGVSAPSFNLSNTEVGTLSLSGSADGRTNLSTLDNTITQVVVQSTRGAGSFTASGSSADRVIISLLGDATVKTLSLTNVSCSVGGFDLDYLKTGSITQDSTSRYGTGTGINSPDYVVNSSVKYRISVDSMVDEPITVR